MGFFFSPCPRCQTRGGRTVQPFGSFGFNNHINHLVQLLGSQLVCVERKGGGGGIKKEEENIYIIGGFVSRKELTFFFFFFFLFLWLISAEDNVHGGRKGGATHCSTSAIVEGNNWWRIGEVWFLKQMIKTLKLLWRKCQICFVLY